MRNVTPRSLGLDILRGIAVLMVLVRHSIPCPAEVSEVGHEVCIWLQQGAWSGVDLFFVLSGFLVGGLLLQEYKANGEIRIGRFLARRGFKIYPPFWIFLSFVLCWNILADQENTPLQIWSELLFFQNYTVGVWGTNWSLAVEEHFYLLLPFVLLFVAGNGVDRRRPFDRLPAVVVVVIVGCLAARILNAHAHAGEEFSTYVYLTPTHLRIDGLFFGVLLAYFYTFFPDRFLGVCREYRWPLLIFGVAGFLPAFALPVEESWFIQVFGLALHWMAGGALLCFTLGVSIRRNWFSRFLAGIGRCSYTTYLWHAWIGLLGLPLLMRIFHLQPTWGVSTVAYFASTLVVGWMLTWLIEWPFLQLRDRLVASPTRKPLAPIEEISTAARAEVA